VTTDRRAVVVAALDIQQANALVQMLTATGRFLAQPIVQASPHYAEAKHQYDALVALFGAAGEKLSVQLALERMDMEPAGKPLLVLGATDTARQLLDGIDLSQWLTLELEGGASQSSV
jgi:hypothetical protein